MSSNFIHDVRKTSMIWSKLGSNGYILINHAKMMINHSIILINHAKVEMRVWSMVRWYGLNPTDFSILLTLFFDTINDHWSDPHFDSHGTTCEHSRVAPGKPEHSWSTMVFWWSPFLFVYINLLKYNFKSNLIQATTYPLTFILNRLSRVKNRAE